MFSDEIRNKLENIVNGIVIEEQGDSCTTIRNILCSSFSTSTTVKKDFEGKSVIKEKQVEFLKQLSNKYNWWIQKFASKWPVSGRRWRGKSIFTLEQQKCYKLNDGVYYATWLEFFNSIVIHNLLFPATAYTFLGFTEDGNILKVALKQSFIESDMTADLGAIKQLLSFNGF